MQEIIKISIILTFLSQTSETNQNNFEMLKQTLNEARFCTEDNGQYKDNSIIRDINRDSNSQTKAIKTVLSNPTKN